VPTSRRPPCDGQRDQANGSREGHTALLEVLEALKTAQVDGRIRQAAQTIYQALIEAELTAVIGAALHERTEARVAQRNGHRPRLLTTTAGDLELRIHKLRAGSFFPACWSGAAGRPGAVRGGDEACPHGVSTRKVDDPVGPWGPTAPRRRVVP
jgi:putative transposase